MDVELYQRIHNRAQLFVGGDFDCVAEEEAYRIDPTRSAEYSRLPTRSE